MKQSKNKKVFMESITISKRMKMQQSMNLLGHDLMINILLKHFQISKKDKSSYLKFCKCENRKPLNDFADYILTKVPNNVFYVTHKGEKYRYYSFLNNVFFTKDGEKLGTFIGEF
jgi:hypothetical protein